MGTFLTVASNVPVAVLGGLSFRGISASEEHTCAVTTSGDGYCWGGNAHGQLGVGTLAYHPSPEGVALIQGLAAVSTGYFHSCVVLGGGDAYCWGHNGVAGSGGQLGNGSFTGTLVPVAVVMP
jgi:alpha-tubulin suppressor-like RCC1 family protein